MLSKPQRRVFDALTVSFAELGRAPTIREVGNVANLKSTSLIHRHLVSLVEKKYAMRDGRKFIPATHCMLCGTPLRSEDSLGS